ncbi:MAG TPA: DNA polymerase [Candidatus Paceibacterota bacterium]|nr:DNA polymerase [Candidatus Paceibacterota bacterium]
MATKKDRLILFDSHAIIHRAYHAVPDFKSSDGTPTGALYGLSNMLMKIIADLKPDYMVAAYDLPKKTFRHEAYDGYKAGRRKTDDELITQIIKSREIFEAFHIPILEAEGFEADDILGTIVHQVLGHKKMNDVEIIIASGDMDTFQLVVKNRVKVFTFKKGLGEIAMYGEEEVVNRYGFLPKYVPDYKGLAGDSSDNIPGIRGIGEKTATNLIQVFGTLEEMYKKIKKDPEVLDKAGLTSRVKNLIIEGEDDAIFSKTLATIRRDAPIDFVLPERFPAGAAQEKIEKLFSELEFRSLVGKVREVIHNGEQIKNGKNGTEKKETAEEIALQGTQEYKREEILRTAIMAWVIDSERTNSTGDDLLFWSKKKTIEEAQKYFEEEIKKDKKNEIVFKEIEEPIIEDIFKMTENGIKVNTKYLEELSVEYTKELNDLKSRIYKLAGREFNVDSPKQLAEVLFKDLGLKPKGSVGKSGSFSTKQEVLEGLAEENPIIDDILKHRELAKLLSTYVDTIPKLVSSDGRLHAEFLQHGTTTGRFSAQNPNLQNLPIKGERGMAIRRAFISEKNTSLVSFDYSQIDLRSLAILSNEEVLVSIFKNREDIHEIVAMKIFGIPKEDVTKDMRRKAKTINFGIIYGMGVSALRKNIGCTTAEAKEFYENYFKQLPGVKNFLENIKVEASKNGFTETLFGRKRFFKDIKSRIPFLRAFAERMATNAPIQGTSADIMKLSIRFAMEDIRSAGIKSAKLILQIHDEIVFEVEDREVNNLVSVVKKAMEEVLPRSYLKLKTDVPLVVNAYAGKSLGELKEIVIK